MSDAALPSSSRARIRRLRAAATKKRMYERTIKLEAARKSDLKYLSEQNQIEPIIQTAQQLVWDLANIVVNLQQYCYPSVLSPDWMPMYEDPDDIDKVKPSCVPTDVPPNESCETEAPSNKLRVAGPKHMLVSEAELREEAATRIQRIFREAVALKSTCRSESNDSIIAEACVHCWKSFGDSPISDDCADRCDMCSSFCHTYCLQEVADEKGKEWSLCGACVTQHASAFHKVSSESEPKASLCEANAGVQNPNVHMDFDCDVPGIDAQASLEKKPIEEGATTTLESRLDYMLKYLELGKDQLPKHIKDAVLSMIKETLSWKTQDRTDAEIEGKIN